MAINRYGYCPQCGSIGVERERRLNGNDICINGHSYPSANALANYSPTILALLSRLDGAAKQGLDLSPGDELCRDAAVVIRQLLRRHGK